jgi:predicted RNA-binding protein YlxR (DUF448 family)
VRDKRDLVRLVRGAAGMVTIDVRGVEPGRGAYVCPRTECVNEVIRTARLARAFRKPCTVGANLTEEVRGLWQQGR